MCAGLLFLTHYYYNKLYHMTISGILADSNIVKSISTLLPVASGDIIYIFTCEDIVFRPITSQHFPASRGFQLKTRLAFSLFTLLNFGY